jgi:hypothetical protein
MAGRDEGSKSSVAASLWAERFHVQPDVFHLIPYNIEETQTLHQQGFTSLIPASNSPGINSILFRCFQLKQFQKISLRSTLRYQKLNFSTTSASLGKLRNRNLIFP